MNMFMYPNQVAECSDVITPDIRYQINFHVRACLNRGRDLAYTLRSVYSNHGFKPHVKFLVEREYAKGNSERFNIDA